MFFTFVQWFYLPSKSCQSQLKRLACWRDCSHLCLRVCVIRLCRSTLSFSVHETTPPCSGTYSQLPLQSLDIRPLPVTLSLVFRFCLSLYLYELFSSLNSLLWFHWHVRLAFPLISLYNCPQSNFSTRLSSLLVPTLITAPASVSSRLLVHYELLLAFSIQSSHIFSLPAFFFSFIVL